MSENDWTLIYSTNLDYQAEIVKELIEENNIDVFVINKKDSFYKTIGEIELYVLKENEEIAKSVIKNFEQ